MKFRYPRLIVNEYEFEMKNYTPIFDFYSNPIQQERYRVYSDQKRKIKGALCEYIYSSKMKYEYIFYTSCTRFSVSKIGTYKYAESLATNYPLVYFQLMNFDPIFLENSSSVEEAVITSIAHARLLGWNGII
jgi:hypothetical protein